MHYTSSILDMTSIPYMLSTELSQQQSPQPARSGSRNLHRSVPKQPIIVPSSYLATYRSKGKPANKSNPESNVKSSLFSFNKINPNRTVFEDTDVKSNTRKIHFDENTVSSKRFRSTSQIKNRLMRTNHVSPQLIQESLKHSKAQPQSFATQWKQTEKIDLQALGYDYGRLSKSGRLTNNSKELHPPISDFTALVCGTDEGSLLTTAQKTEKHKLLEVTLKEIETVRFNILNKSNQVSAKKSSALENSQHQNSGLKTNKKKGRSYDNHSQNLSPCLILSNSKPQQQSERKPVAQKKRLNSRIVTMFSHGKVEKRVVNYPDNTEYLKLCGIKK